MLNMTLKTQDTWLILSILIAREALCRIFASTQWFADDKAWPAWLWNDGVTMLRCFALRYRSSHYRQSSNGCLLEAQCIIGGFGGHAAACFISCLAMLHASSCIFMHLRAAWNDLNIKSMLQLVSTSPVPTNAAYLSMPMLQGYA